MDIFFYYGNLLLSYGIIGCIMLRFMSELYTRKYSENWIYLVAWVLFVILSGVIYRTEIPILKSIFGIVSLFIISFFLFYFDSKKVMIGYSLFFFLFLAMTDSLSVIFFSLISQTVVVVVRNSNWFLFLSGTCNAILLLCFYRFFINLIKYRHIELITIQQNVFLIVLTFFQLSLGNYIMILSEETSNGVVQVAITLCFLALDFYLIYLFESISKKNHLEQEVALAKQQGIMQNNYFATIEAQYDDSQRLIHDMKNHLLTLENMYRHSDDERGDEKAYTEMIYEKMDQLGSRFKCDNRVLTIIINDKIRKSEELGITFKTEIENLNLDFMSSFDMTTIFSNLLDNAIEACEEVEREKRMIHVRMYRFNDFIILNIKNTTEKPPVKEKNRFSSTKGQGHFGLGLTNVQKSIEHYEGTVEYEYKEKLFYTKVIFPYLYG